MFICFNCLKEFDDQDEFFEHYTLCYQTTVEKTKKFYVGQKVKITANTCYHPFEIGSVVTLEAVEECSDGSWDLYHNGWVFDQDDCEPIEENK